MPPGKKTLQLPGSGLNPMEIPEVLEQIFKYCPVSDLRSVRLVSNFWLETSLPVWRQKAVVRICGRGLASYQQDNSNYYKSLGANWGRWSHTTSISEFLEVDQLSSSPNKRFTNFKIDLGCLPKQVWGWGEISEFWRVCGPNVKHLHLIGDILLQPGYLRDAILGPTTPALETLIIECGHLFLYDDMTRKQDGAGATPILSKPSVKYLQVCVPEQWLPVSWEELMTCFTGLEELSIRSKRVGGPANLLAPITVLKNMREAGKMIKLKHLTLGEPIMTESVAKEVLSLLLESKLNLQTLKLQFGYSMGSLPPPEYYRLLKTQKGTLGILDVGTLTTPDAFILPLANTFSALDSLTISLLEWDNGGFLADTPNLSSLTVLSSEYDKDYEYVGNGERVYCRDVGFRAGINCPKLKNLVFQGNFSLPDFRSVTRCMPNVDSLAIPLDDDSFRVVCQRWTKLRHLTILEKPDPTAFVSDAGIVGRGLQPGLPCIRNLKGLCSLKWIRRDVPTRECHLTGASLFGGFFRLPHLLHLEIIAELPMDEMKLLFERVPNAVMFWWHPMYQQRFPQPLQRRRVARKASARRFAPKYVILTNVWNA